MKSIMTAVLLTAENRIRLSAKGAVMRPVLLLVFVLLSTGVNAQWLNFRTPGTPRSRDGKPNLTAPAPRAADGKPDLGGVWMHELTSTAELKRLFGPVIDEAAKVEVPGMEIGTLHKYGFSILLDFKPGEAPMRQKAVDIMQLASQRNPPDVCTTPAGIPLVSFLSEPIKIIQSPRLAVILHEDNTHRQIYTDGRVLRNSSTSLPIGATRSDAGRARRSSSKPRASTTKPSWISSATPIAKPCASSSDFDDATLATSRST